MSGTTIFPCQTRSRKLFKAKAYIAYETILLDSKRSETFFFCFTITFLYFILLCNRFFQVRLSDPFYKVYQKIEYFCFSRQYSLKVCLYIKQYSYNYTHLKIFISNKTIICVYDFRILDIQYNINSFEIMDFF